jgi:purine-binding chemotaxis protein CheW
VRAAEGDAVKEMVGDVEIADENDAVSLCWVYAGEGSFGIETKKIREVLDEHELHRVPLAPAFIRGVMSYRGEVLTTVDLRVLLGLEEHEGKGCVMVLDDEEATERFGLLVDAAGGVVRVRASMLEANPWTLEARGRWLFGGSYRVGSDLMVRLDPQRLCPSRLAETGLFRHRMNGGLDASTDRR